MTNLQVKTTQMFNFSSFQDGTTFNFGIAADSHGEACDKLERALLAIVEELRAIRKPGAN